MNNFLNMNVEDYKIYIKSSEKYIKEMYNIIMMYLMLKTCVHSS